MKAIPICVSMIKTTANRKLLLIAVVFLLCGGPKAVRAQTPDTLAPVARQPFFATDGSPLANGCVFTYNSGTSTPAATYTDYTGLFTASNPIILDGGGFATIWITSQAYRFVLVSAGGTNCSTGSQQWLIDGILPPPFAAGNNAFTGVNSFSGATTFSAAVTLSGGGTLSGAFAGSPTFSGNPTFSGFPIFTNQQPFPVGIAFDAAVGNNASVPMSVTALSGAGSNNGQGIVVISGNGGSTGGVGGEIALETGNAVGGNAAGGQMILGTGNGVGTGSGGDYDFAAGAGGSAVGRGGNYSIRAGHGGAGGDGGAVSIMAGPGGAGGNGGDISLIAGDLGSGGKTGSLIFGLSGRLKFNVTAAGVAPNCASTGLDTGTCTIANYSTDTSGTIILTAGTTALALGQITLSFNQTMGANGSFCMYTLISGNGTWDPRATVIGKSDGSLNSIALWDNNSATLTAGDVYNVHYFCRGEN